MWMRPRARQPRWPQCSTALCCDRIASSMFSWLVVTGSHLPCARSIWQERRKLAVFYIGFYCTNSPRGIKLSSLWPATLHSFVMHVGSVTIPPSSCEAVMTQQTTSLLSLLGLRVLQPTCIKQSWQCGQCFSRLIHMRAIHLANR